MRKLDKVYQEMIEMGVACDKPTYYIRLSAYAAASDIDGMEKVLKNMEENSSPCGWNTYLICDLKLDCNKGEFDKAAAYVDQVIAKGKQPPASTWVRFVTAYVRKNDLEKAVEMMKKCVVAEDKRGCRLNKDTLEACVEYLKENGDLQMAEEIEKAFGHMIRSQQTSAASLDDDKESELKRRG
ncbi:pentatricopeptide repeat-containing protein [Tanacetum coccineum]